MTTSDLFALSPLIVLAATSVIVMLAIAIKRNHLLTAVLTLIGLALALLTLQPVSAVAPHRITSLLIIDHYALFFMGLVFAASFVVAILSYSYLEKHPVPAEEFYLLLLLATLGSAVLVASNHFVAFFLGLEILTVALYALVAYLRPGQRSIGAGIKYLVLAGVSTAFLLFGMALIYAELGTMDFRRLAQLQATIGTVHTGLTLTGLMMVLIGIGFKLAVVPFHMWTPDVYEGAPAPVTAYVATVSKGAMFALLLRYYTLADVHAYNSLILVFTIIAIASMFVGNLLALLQNNVKRMLAYSSIAHLGYLLVAFLASGALAATAVAFYLVAYFVTTLGAFGIVTVMSSQERDADAIDDYRGLFWRQPWLAAALTAMLLSLAGIPLTAGFVGKFYVVTAGVGSALWLLVITLVVNSAIGLFYYLRVVVAMSTPLPEGAQPPTPVSLSLANGLILTALVLLLIGLGIFPSPLIRMIQAVMAAVI
jgi:NADH-quinone oxidoreductase subunit N